MGSSGGFRIHSIIRFYRMEDKDFISNFNKIEICHLGPDVMEGIHLAGNHDLSKNPKWMSAIYHTSFISRRSGNFFKLLSLEVGRSIERV